MRWIDIRPGDMIVSTDGGWECAYMLLSVRYDDQNAHFMFMRLWNDAAHDALLRCTFSLNVCLMHDSYYELVSAQPRSVT